MSTALSLLQTFLAHPAPGLLYAPHDGAKLGERAYTTSHKCEPPPTARSLEALQKLCERAPRELADVRAVWERWDGVDLLKIQDPDVENVYALSLLPIGEWDRASAAWHEGGDCSDFMRDCEMYTRGTWRVIGQLSSEGMCLVLFFDGEHEGAPLAGRMFCLGLDGYLGFEEELAPNFSAFVAEFTRDPARFFDRLGFTPSVSSRYGCFGDPIQTYMPDIRGHPSLQSPDGNPRDQENHNEDPNQHGLFGKP